MDCLTIGRRDSIVTPNNVRTSASLLPVEASIGESGEGKVHFLRGLVDSLCMVVRLLISEVRGVMNGNSEGMFLM